jgi:catechol 2,3-dioxygenase-like lactoylglutathione lyase family enzyme
MRLHHVNLAVHPDVLDDEIGFLTGGLGLTRLDPGPELADRSRWFAFADGTEVHLSRTTDPIHTAPGHVALVVGDAFDAIEARLLESGLPAVRQEGRSPAVTILRDPAGHLWEIRADE